MKIREITIIIVILTMITSCNAKQTDSQNTEKIEPSHAISIENPSIRIGFADYVFVGEIVDIVGTEYRHHVIDDKGQVIEGTGSPYTEFRVKIVENIKGDLEADREITVFQAGGVAENSNTIVVYEGYDLMEEENIYIIETSVQSDGTLLTSGPSSSVKINVNNKSDLFKNEKYKSYLKYAENQIEFERIRFEIYDYKSQ